MLAFDPERHTFRSPKIESIVQEAIAFISTTPVYPLPPGVTVLGCGVYALYYRGDLGLYGRIAEANQVMPEVPIYVGKAVAPGWRTARVAASQTPDLSRRLIEHARSIAQADNLRIEDFVCRFMILEGIEGDLIVPVEAELIRIHRPLWNSAVDGFGNHDPGSGRYDQARSEWDVLHPGRIWADRLRGQSPNLSEVIARIQDTLG